MRSRASTVLVLSSLMLAGGWGVWKIIDNSQPNIQPPVSFKSTSTPVSKSPPQRAKSGDVKPRTISDSFKLIDKLLLKNQFDEAVDEAHLLYSSLDSAQAADLISMFLSHAMKLQRRQQPRESLSLIKSFSQYFDDIDAWKLMGQIAASLKIWPTAIDAYTRYSVLEYRPELLDSSLMELSDVANLYRNHLQQHGDRLTVRDLFQNLYETHPTHAGFQLSLAEAQIAVNNIDEARQILNLLQFDPDLGELAKQTLARLDDEALQAKNEAEELAKQAEEDLLPTDVVVPLTKVGTSFLADVSFGNRAIPMLLDTGASITSMSAAAIQNLGFQATGRSIQISTANGLTSAPLYRADKVRLGRFDIEGLVVAEIDLGGDGNFQGLLGTDLLNQVNQNYGYVIDNQQSALIFRRR